MRFFALVALLAGLAPGARACDEILDAVRSEIREAYRMDVSCRDLQEAAKTLPVAWTSQSEGQWGYAGEQALRDELWNRFEARVSTSILPIGLVDRTSPEGPGVVIVFGLEMPRRSWALLAVTQQDGPVTPERAAAVLGEGSVYDWVGIFPRDAQGRPAPERWIRLKNGGAWSAARPAPVGEARACLPCRGWLCPKDPIVCFADFDGNAREEALLIDDCHEACGTRMLEADETGRYGLVFDQPGVYGRWTRRPEGWVLVSDPFCPPGDFCASSGKSLGNPNCLRPDVYRFDAPSGHWTADAALREEYYPVEDRTAPSGCEADPKGTLVYTPKGRFVRYRAP